MDEVAVAALLNEADRELYNDDAPEVFAKEFAAHLETVKKSSYDEGFQTSERKVNKEWRDAGKALGVKSDKKDAKDFLSDLIGIKGNVEVTEDVVKKSPLFIQLEQENLGLKNGFDTKIKEAIDAKDAEYQRERTLSLVTEKADEFLLSLKPILSKDPLKAKNQRKPFHDELRSLNYQVLDSDQNSFLMLDQSNKRLEDKFGHPVKFTDQMKVIAEKYFDFEQGEQRSSAGDPAKGTAKTSTVALPTDPKELQKFLFNAQNDPNMKPEQLTALLAEVSKR